MSSFNQTLNRDKNPSTLQSRQKNLIFYTTIELILLCTIIISLYALSGVWYMVTLISVSCLLSALNLCALLYTNNTYFCGHFITTIVLLTICTANYLVGGMGTEYSVWFYIIPLLAVSLIGWRGLLLYSLLSLGMILFFGVFHPEPVYHLPAHQLKVIEWTNHLIALLVIVTTLNSLMRENKLYEQILNDKNYLLQAEKERFEHLAQFDQLTNLPNRQYFLQHLQGVMSSLSVNYCITVFFMDVDNFKYINDFFGHSAGDSLLQQTANRLKMCFREVDFIARLGGDEFTAIVAHPQNEPISAALIKRIQQGFNKPFIIQEQEHLCSLSIGIATYPTEAQTVTELMNKADIAMYAVKKERELSQKIPYATK